MKNVKSLPCRISRYDKEVEDGFYKAKVYIAHEGVNRNKSNLSVENMKKAENTIKNRPLLAYILYDEEGNAEDFDGHNMVLKTVESEEGKQCNLHYLEKPIGIFPESCNPHYETINDVIHFVADCYIWENYSNEAIDLIFDANGEKQVSMEITVNDYQTDDNGIMDILDYEYRAVTVLGDHKIQGMNGTAGLEMYEKTDEYISRFAEEITNKIQEYELKEGEVMKKDFGLGVEQIYSLVSAKLSDLTYEDSWGYTSKQFYIRDIDLTENKVILSDLKNNRYVGVDIKVSDNDIDFSIEGAEEYVSSWIKRGKEAGGEFNVYEKYTEELKEKEEAKRVEFSKMKEDLEAKQADCNTYESQISELEEEVKALREFKASAEAEAERESLENAMNEIDSDFAFEAEEIAEFKEKVFSKEMTIEGYKRELFVLEGMKSLNAKKKQKFEGNTDNNTEIEFSLNDENKEELEKKQAKKEAYNGLFERYS